MKSIKIKLSKSNQGKKNGLLSVLKTLDLISQDYLAIRIAESKSKIYKPFKEHYVSFRVLYPALNSGVLQSHLRTIDSQIKSHISWCKKRHKPVSFPKTIHSSIPLRNDMFKFGFNLNSKEFDAWMKFLRIHYPLKLCKYHKRALLNFDSLSDSSIIKNPNGELTLRLVFKTMSKPIDSSKVLGIDLGICKPIVFSNGKIIGSGSYIKHRKLEFGKKRAKHQKLKAEISAKQSRWTNDLNHKLSRSAVDYAISQGIGVLSLENLKGTQLSNRRFRRYNWAFKDLLKKVAYKAKLAGLKVVHVNPAYTSQTCSDCGLKSKDNRKSQSRFHCDICNLVANADVNAAKNIANLSIGDGVSMNPPASQALILETTPSLVVK